MKGREMQQRSSAELEPGMLRLMVSVFTPEPQGYSLSILKALH